MKKINKNKKIRLGVNIDHVATLRQVRAGTTAYPDIHKMARLAVSSGADQITIHLREDRRHIQLQDLVTLSKDSKINLNLEMAATPEMFRLALKYKPKWVCIVPEKREELTTEGGLNVSQVYEILKKMIPKLHKQKIKVSLFIAPQAEMIQAAYELKADAVEFHTGHWVLAQGKKRTQMWYELYNGARLTHNLGMNVHAGHGLDFETSREITELPYLEEVNIGHSLICYSIEMGLKKSIQTIKSCLKNKK